jgi:hypothetical protein
MARRPVRLAKANGTGSRHLRELVRAVGPAGPIKPWTKLGESSPADRTLWTPSAMTLHALRHGTNPLDYLALLENQSVFNFGVITAAMAQATLEVYFMNPDVLRNNVKIREGHAVQVRLGGSEGGYWLSVSSYGPSSLWSPKRAVVTCPTRCGRIVDSLLLHVYTAKMTIICEIRYGGISQRN